MPGEQLVKQHAERIDVRARVHVVRVEFRLFRTHVGGRADEHIETGEQRLVRELDIARRFGHAEVDDLGQRHAIV